MVDITVEGYARPFSCAVEDDWTVEEAEERIREEYGLVMGGIKVNNKATKPGHKIKEGFVYVFVGGKKEESAPQPLSK
jgi:hypothetical protein